MPGYRKPLKMNEVPKEAHPFLDFDNQRAMNGEGLYIRVSCPYCPKPKWRQAKEIRRSIKKGYRYTGHCVVHAIPSLLGTLGPGWEEGKYRTDSGYIDVHIKLFSGAERRILQPMVKCNNYIMEHRAIMALCLGRPLKPFPQETVHHINGIKDDNRIENLELRHGQHGINASRKVPHCETCVCNH